MNEMNVAFAVLVLIFFILVGLVFDIIGLAIATADEKQFHSMAAQKIKSAKYAVKLIRNAEKVSSFCNDVIGDIAGIMSGATGSAIAVVLFITDRANIIGTFLITAGVAAVTVGSKAFGKSVAISHNGAIVNIVSKAVCFFAGFGRKNK
jgi:CBS domain containing-hemolysin-like protein